MVVKCPQCKHYVSDTTSVCPHCGAVLKEETPVQSSVTNPNHEAITQTVDHPVEEAVQTSTPEPKPAQAVPPHPILSQEVESKPTPEPISAPVAKPPVDSSREASTTVTSAPVSSAPVAPPPMAYQQAEKKNTTLIAVIVALIVLLCGVGGYLYYDNVYLPEKIDSESPRTYTMANMVVLRSSRSSGADFNKIASVPFGTELITYDQDSEWARVKVASPNAEGKKLEGFVASAYILGKQDFFLLNSIFGNQDSRETISTTKCRMALLNYFKNRGYIGNIDAQIRTEAGITTTPSSDNSWQVFCKPKDAKPNSVLFKRLFNKNSQFTDFAVIICNITNGERKLLYFYFDDDETPHLLTEQDAPREGYIKDAYTIRNYYSGEEQLNVVYSN